jgi:hypothetical protein
MTQRCKTCYHPERSAIDIALARGIPGRTIARQFGLPETSVSRHRRHGHVPAEIIAAFPRQTQLNDEALRQLRIDESAGILLSLARQRKLLLQAQERAVTKRDNEWLVRTASAIHRNVELVARACGTFAEHERAIHQTNQIAVMMTPEYVTLRAKLIAALRPFPAAREAVGGVLAELEQAPVHWDGIRPGLDGVKQIEASAEHG